MKRHVLLLAGLLILSGIIYWPGLYGQFIFDDLANLEVFKRWLQNEVGWQYIVFSNQSGLLGRPISMATFLVDASIWGLAPFGFKLGNLFIHALTGLSIYFLIHRVAIRDRDLSPRATLAALLITAVWLLHPMFASTVLYAVQRMAMLSALFIVLALLAYVHGRECLEAGKSQRGLAWLFAGVPVLTLLGMFSKENGALAPLLCGVIEFVYFVPKNSQPRPTSVRVFLLAGVALPIAGAIALLLFYPEFYFQGYENRPFGPIERLLTETRILFDYVGNLLIPSGAALTLFRDDYPISTSLFSPITTVLSVAGWATLIVLAIRFRKEHPGFSAGIGLFLVGHSMESGIFPLLLYFEHRNYFPGLGIFLALASIIAVMARRAKPFLTRPRVLGATAATLLILVLAAGTHARAWVWQSRELLARQAVENYPDSRFARMELASILMNKVPPQVEDARRHYKYLAAQDRPSTRIIGNLGLIAVSCHIDGTVSRDTVDQVFSESPETIEADLLKAAQTVERILNTKECVGLSPRRFADGIVSLVNSSGLPEYSRPIWTLRYRAARLYYNADAPGKALRQAQIAWNSGKADLPVGMLAAGLLLHLGRHKEAAELLQEIGPRLPATDISAQTLLEEYTQALKHGLRQ